MPCWLLSSACVSARGRVFVWRAGRRLCGTASPTHCWLSPLDAPPRSRGSSLAAAPSTTAWSGEKRTLGCKQIRIRQLWDTFLLKKFMKHVLIHVLNVHLISDTWEFYSNMAFRLFLQYRIWITEAALQKNRCSLWLLLLWDMTCIQAPYKFKLMTRDCSLPLNIHWFLIISSQ